ncbi:ubiquitin family protein [Ancylostoma caninum]|uniref:Ubiquitin carboxyl-terminal hydrolase n=2 Tax=Ancylostoma TaxID=29169 RepID=A0A368GVQ6_ANCCA|nr:ubiquitin family protein [Ancylostoma caninum]
MPNVNVKWGKEKYEVLLDFDEPPLVFKSQLFALTGVPPDRQKVVVKGKTLGDESWTGITISEGAMIMMMGSADAVPAPPKPEDEKKEIAENEEKTVKLPSGLKNLGNTCYMNSVLQSFKTIPEIKYGLQRLNQAGQETDVNKKMAMAVKSVYEMLDNPRRTADEPLVPFFMLQALHSILPQFSSRDEHGHLEQQDANECFSEIQRMLLSALSANKDLVGKDIREFFRGRYQVTQKCLESDEEPIQKTTEEFYQLSCFLSPEVRYIQSGIKEKLSGEIEKTSTALGRNAKWERNVLIDRLPAYVSVQMVRFFYKESSQVNAKILKDVKFPMILDLCDICTPALQERLRPARDAVKKEEDAKIERMRKQKMDGTDPKTVEDDGKPLPFSFPDDEGSNNSGFYELKAVITHKGRSSNSGHYVAWVRLDEDKWAMCDDEHVSPVTSEQVLKLSGGGDWHCAYVLLYGPRIVKEYPELKEEKENANISEQTKEVETMQTN